MIARFPSVFTLLAACSSSISPSPPARFPAPLYAQLFVEGATFRYHLVTQRLTTPRRKQPT